MCYSRPYQRVSSLFVLVGPTEEDCAVLVYNIFDATSGVPDMEEQPGADPRDMHELDSVCPESVFSRAYTRRTVLSWRITSFVQPAVFQAQKNNQQLNPKDTQDLDLSSICPNFLFFIRPCIRRTVISWCIISLVQPTMFQTLKSNQDMQELDSKEICPLIVGPTKECPHCLF